METGELLTPAQLDEACEAVKHLDPRDALVLAMAAIVHARGTGGFLHPKIRLAIEEANPFIQALMESTR